MIPGHLTSLASPGLVLCTRSGGTWMLTQGDAGRARSGARCAVERPPLMVRPHLDSQESGEQGPMVILTHTPDVSAGLLE